MNLQAPGCSVKDLGVGLSKLDFIAGNYDGKVLSQPQTGQKVMNARSATARCQGDRNAGALQVLKQFLNAGKHLDSLPFASKQHILDVTMRLNLVVRKFAQKKPKNFLLFSALPNDIEISVAY